jgi:hypothetical protein
VVAEDKKEVKKRGDGKSVKEIDEKELHGRTSCLWRSKEEAINEESVCDRFPQNAMDSFPLKAEVMLVACAERRLDANKVHLVTE